MGKTSACHHRWRHQSSYGLCRAATAVPWGRLTLSCVLQTLEQTRYREPSPPQEGFRGAGPPNRWLQRRSLEFCQSTDPPVTTRPLNGRKDRNQGRSIADAAGVPRSSRNRVASICRKAIPLQTARTARRTSRRHPRRIRVLEDGTAACSHVAHSFLSPEIM